MSARGHEASDASDAHGEHGHAEGNSSMLIEYVLFGLLVCGAGYALFGPKSPPSEHAEAPAAAPRTVPSAREAARQRLPGMPGSARMPGMPGSAIPPRELAEMQLIQGARRSLSQGKPDDALNQLKSYEKDFPEGKLADDVSLVRLEVLLKKGDQAGAKKIADALNTKSPGSRHAKRAQRLLVPHLQPGEVPSATTPQPR